MSTDNVGTSLGHGFVHFETQESADKAVDDMEGKDLHGLPMSCGKFERKETKMQELDKSFTNCYVKHLNKDLTDEQVEAFCGKHGTVESLKVVRDDSGSSRGYAFVNFTEHEAAQGFVEACNETEQEGISQEVCVLPGGACVGRGVGGEEEEEASITLLNSTTHFHLVFF